MASESRLFTISGESKQSLRRFRMGTSRKQTLQAQIYQIDKQSLEVSQKARDDNDATAVYTTLDDIADDLPGNTPRYVLLSYPVSLTDGRLKVPYVMLSYMPPTTTPELRMLYAGAKELLKNESGASQCIDIESEEDLNDLEDKLKGDT